MITLKFARCGAVAKAPHLTLKWIDFRLLSKEGCSVSFRRCQFGNLFRLLQGRQNSDLFLCSGCGNLIFFHGGKEPDFLAWRLVPFSFAGMIPSMPKIPIHCFHGAMEPDFLS
jgi:hypothetical protein